MDYRRCHDIIKLLLILMCVTYVDAFKKGAPARVCDSMVPGHSATPMVDGSPYTIVAIVETCKKDVTVTLSGSEPFLGFLCEPRPEIHDAKTSGTFTPLGDTSLMQNKCETKKTQKRRRLSEWTLVAAGHQLILFVTDLDCTSRWLLNEFKLTSLCHTSNATKTSLQFKWTPEGNETAYIVCSFVKKYDTFWVKQSSPAIKLNLNDPSCMSSAASQFTPSLPAMLLVLVAIILFFRALM